MVTHAQSSTTGMITEIKFYTIRRKQEVKLVHISQESLNVCFLIKEQPEVFLGTNVLFYNLFYHLQHWFINYTFLQSVIVMDKVSICDTVSLHLDVLDGCDTVC